MTTLLNNVSSRRRPVFFLLQTRRRMRERKLCATLSFRLCENLLIDAADAAAPLVIITRYPILQFLLHTKKKFFSELPLYFRPPSCRLFLNDDILIFNRKLFLPFFILGCAFNGTKKFSLLSKIP